jgi:hypothetical protein
MYVETYGGGWVVASLVAVEIRAISFICMIFLVPVISPQ